MSIENFFTWFLNSFIIIGQDIINKLDNIYLVGTVSLLDFVITITLISAFIGIILTLPQNANRVSTRIERRTRSKNDK